MAGNQIVVSSSRVNSLASELAGIKGRITKCGVRFSGSLASDYGMNKALAEADALIETTAQRIGNLSSAVSNAAAEYDGLSRKANFSEVAALASQTLSNSQALMGNAGDGQGGAGGGNMSAQDMHTLVEALLNGMDMESLGIELPDVLNMDTLQQLLGDSVDLSGIKDAGEFLQAVKDFTNGDATALTNMITDFSYEKGAQILVDIGACDALDASTLKQAIDLGISLGEGMYYGADASIATWQAGHSGTAANVSATALGMFTGAVTNVAAKSPVGDLAFALIGSDYNTFMGEQLPAFVDNMAWAMDQGMNYLADGASDVWNGLKDAGSDFVNWLCG